MKKFICSILTVIIFASYCFGLTTVYAGIETEEDFLAACIEKDASNMNELLIDITKYYLYDTLNEIAVEMQALSLKKIEYLRNSYNKGMISEDALRAAIVEYSNIKLLVDDNALEEKQYILDIEQKTDQTINEYDFDYNEFYLLYNKDKISLDDAQKEALNQYTITLDEEKTQVMDDVEKMLIDLEGKYGEIINCAIDLEVCMKQSSEAEENFNLGLVEIDDVYSKKIIVKLKQSALHTKIVEYSLALIDLNIKTCGYVADEADHFETYIGTKADWPIQGE